MKNLYDIKHEAELIEKLKSLEVSPPDGLWDDIEETVRLKRSRRIIIITSIAAAATVALLVTIGGYSYMNPKVNSNGTASNTLKESINTNESVSPFLTNSPDNSSSNRQVPIIKRNVNQKIIINPTAEESNVTSNEVSRWDENPKTINALKPKSFLEKSLFLSKISTSKNKQTNGNYIAMSESSDKKHKGEWFISASGFPVYSFHTAGVMKYDETQNEYGLFSWGGSIGIRYSFSNNLSIEGGMTISSFGQQERNLYLMNTNLRAPLLVFSNLEVSNSYGTLTVNSENYQLVDESGVQTQPSLRPTVNNYTKVKAIQQFRYIELPILLAKRFYLRGYQFSLKAGFSESILINNRLDYFGDKIHLKGETKGIDKFSTSVLTAVSFSIPVAKKVILLIEPNLKFGLKSLNAPYGKSYPFSTYIKFGFEVPL